MTRVPRHHWMMGSLVILSDVSSSGRPSLHVDEVPPDDNRLTGEEIVLTKCMSAGEKGPLVTAATARAPTLYAYLHLLKLTQPTTWQVLVC